MGSGGYVEIADNSSLDNQQFSLEAWVSPVNAGSFDANGNAIIEKDLNSGSVGSVKIGWSPQTNKFGFGFGNYGTEYIFSTDTFAPGQFYHVVATYDGSTFSLYVNGTLEASRILAKTITYDTAIPWTIGSNAGIFGYGRRWQGTIDAVGFFNRALSPAEVWRERMPGPDPVRSFAATRLASMQREQPYPTPGRASGSKLEHASP